METTEQDYRWLQRRADRICSLILHSEYPSERIRAAQFALRHQMAWRFPDKLELYEMIYESRFRRLWQQFRTDAPPCF